MRALFISFVFVLLFLQGNAQEDKVMILPQLELLSFEADLVGSTRAPIVEVKWVVLQAADLEKYAVYHSLNGKDWASLREVVAAVDEVEALEYSYIDVQAEQGVHYYKLELLSKNGKVLETSTTVVNVENRSAAPLKAYPNPQENEVHIVYWSKEKGTLRIELIDNDGHSFADNEQSIRRGVNEFTYSTMDVKGSYIVRATDAEGKVVQKVVD